MSEARNLDLTALGMSWAHLYFSNSELSSFGDVAEQKSQPVVFNYYDAQMYAKFRFYYRKRGSCGVQWIRQALIYLLLLSEILQAQGIIPTSPPPAQQPVASNPTKRERDSDDEDDVEALEVSPFIYLNSSNSYWVEFVRDAKPSWEQNRNWLQKTIQKEGQNRASQRWTKLWVLF